VIRRQRLVYQDRTQSLFSERYRQTPVGLLGLCRGSSQSTARSHIMSMPLCSIENPIGGPLLLAIWKWQGCCEDKVSPEPGIEPRTSDSRRSASIARVQPNTIMLKHWQGWKSFFFLSNVPILMVSCVLVCIWNDIHYKIDLQGTPDLRSKK